MKCLRFFFSKFHGRYVPYRTRIHLLGHLMNYANTISSHTGKLVLNDRTRLLFDWEMIDNSPARPLVRTTARRYRIENARTDFKYTNPLHWALMLLLLCEQFVKEDRQEVWKDTAREAMEITKECEEQKDLMADFGNVFQNAVDSVKQGEGRRITRGMEDSLNYNQNSMIAARAQADKNISGHLS